MIALSGQHSTGKPSGKLKKQQNKQDTKKNEKRQNDSVKEYGVGCS